MQNQVLQTEPEFVPCKRCGNLTDSTGTQLCNGCWELDRRISCDYKFAALLLGRIGREQFGYKALIFNIQDNIVTITGRDKDGILCIVAQSQGEFIEAQ